MLTDSFFAAVRTSSRALNCEPADLLAVMMSDSGLRVDAHNPEDDSSGLIRFTPQMLVNLGWTDGPEPFRRLPAEQQMRYVETYFQPFRARNLRPAPRLYQARVLPATLEGGSDLHTVICAAEGPFGFAYRANQWLDRYAKGRITVGDLLCALYRACRGPRWEELRSRLVHDRGFVSPLAGSLPAPLRQDPGTRLVSDPAGRRSSEPSVLSTADD